MMQTDTTFNYLHLHGVKPSLQRMAVMRYLLEHHTHPTAEEIYQSLHPSMPTLSRTTVYNTLRLLTEHGAVQQLTIDERNQCFDSVLEPHAHFLCTRCGKIYDVPLREAGLQAVADLPKGFVYEQSSLYFRGCCKECLEKDKDKQGASHNPATNQEA